MKQETKKEFGKLIYDFAKIGGAITLITPFAQDKPVSIGAIISVIVAVAIGTYIINQGANDG
jgi:hypothetical protein